MEHESSIGGGIRLTVLDENHTYIEQFYLGEPAFSVLVEDGDEKILFDAGYSDVVIRNAETMGIDLNKLVDAGAYISAQLGRKSGSRVATALLAKCAG